MCDWFVKMEDRAVRRGYPEEQLLVGWPTVGFYSGDVSNTGSNLSASPQIFLWLSALTNEVS